MRLLFLIRHATPAITPTRPARTWPLSAAGEQQAAALAPRLQPYQPLQLFTSPEPKAAQTAALVAQPLHLPYTVTPGLHEHERETVGWHDRATFRALVARMFAEPHTLVLGEETAAQASARFTQALSACLPATGNVAVFTHGTVLTLFVAHHNPVDPVAFWEQLTMPAIIALQLPTFALEPTWN